MALLTVSDLRTFFKGDSGDVRAVDGVSFSIDEGETLGIVGESGCGKTVTALSIMGLLSSGRIMEGSSVVFDEEELVAASPRRLQTIRGNEISMIFQEPMTSLNPVYSIGEQVAEVLRAHRGMGRKEARSRTVAMLADVGLADPEQRYDDPPHQLSGGMQQRVMIAMALCCEPRLLIADEPTTALDVTVQAQILSLLSRLQSERTMALILVTHDLGVVAETCDRILVMYAGQVVEEGPVSAIFRDPRHPYTKGLLDSIPTLGEWQRRLNPIPGVVPDPGDWPRGCRFHDRCPEAMTRCGEQAPPLIVTPTGRSRCWLEATDEGRPSEVNE